MSLVLTEEQNMLRDAARSFCLENSPVSVLRKLRDENDATGFDRHLWEQMVELGWAGMALPEQYGGFEFGYSGLGIVLEETGRTLVSSPLISTVLLGATAINIAASDQQKADLLPKVIAGDLTLAFAIDETPFHQPRKLATSARQDGEAYRINGRKCFVLDGHVANLIIVVARVDNGGAEDDAVALFLVDPEASGVTVQRTDMVDSRNSANVILEEVLVPAEALLGHGALPVAKLDSVLDIARIGVAAEMLGSVQQVFEQIIEYLKQREQFGVLIGAFQALQHRAAIMYSEIELCKSSVRAALSALDDQDTSAEEIARLASLCKAKLCEVGELVSNEGIQMHGGIGMTDEFDIGFYLKRARVAQQFLGDASFHRDRYATLQHF